MNKNDLCGIVIPSGIYSDLGTRQLREALFSKTTIDGLFCFENRKFIFEGVDMRFKFVVLTFQKGGQTKMFPARFMQHDVGDLATFPEQEAMWLSVDVIRRLSPDSLSIMEFKSDLDVVIAEKMVKWEFLGDDLPNTWNFSLTREIDMTNDSGLFLQKSLVNTMPLYEGKMIWHFEHGMTEPRYWLKASDVNEKSLSPRVKSITRLMQEHGITESLNTKAIKFGYSSYRLGFRAVTGATNERALVVSVIPQNVVAGNSLITSVPYRDEIENGKWIQKSNYTGAELLFCASIMSSFACDWYVRQKILTNMNMFYVYQLPVPRLSAKDKAFAPIVERAAKLICTTPEFDELAKEVGLGSHKKGATDPKERAKLRAELDGMIAHLYGLTESEFTHILSTFPLVGEDFKSAAMGEFGKTPSLPFPKSD